MNTNSCSSCGYSTHINALQFHHINPNAKEFQITSTYFNPSLDIPLTVKDELDKCEVLCCNCHVKRHIDLDFFNMHSVEIEKIMKSISDDDIRKQYDYDAILRSYMSTNDVEVVAKAHNVSRDVVLRVLRKNLIGDFDDVIDENILLDLHSKGLNSREMSRILNRPQSSICRKMNKLGLVPNKRTSHTIRIKFSKIEILELLKTKTYEEIGAMCGTSKQAIYKKVRSK